MLCSVRDTARCGPTPLTYWTGAPRSNMGRGSRRGEVSLRLQADHAGLKSDALDAVRQAERRRDIDAVGPLRLPRRRGHAVGDQRHRDGPTAEPGLLEIERAEAVLLVLVAALQLHRHAAGQQPQRVDTLGRRFVADADLI